MRGLRIPSLPSQPRSVSFPGGGDFSPLTLFAASEPGVWLDPSDISTLFQDTAGTTPVTAAGQPVGRILDKSGRGNHATQATAAARPIYGVHPFRGKVNNVQNNRWTGYTPQTLSGNLNLDSMTLASPAGHGISVQIVGTGTADGIPYLDLRYFGTCTGSTFFGTIAATDDVATGAGVVDTVSCYAALIAGALPSTSCFHLFRHYRDAADGLLMSGQQSIPVLTGTLSRYSNAFTSPASTTKAKFRGAFVRIAVGETVDFTVRVGGIQHEFGASATGLQLSTASGYNVTEEGQASIGYLAFDGIDDFLVTSTITPGTDKVQVVAGVRKLSDAAQSIVVELTGSLAGNNGAFAVQAPAGAAANFGFVSKGTVAAFATSAASFAAPNTAVLAAQAEISTDSATLRRNGTQIATVATDQGIGNYANDIVYIGRRGGTSLPFNGRLHGLITRFGPNLTADQISQTERWMAQRTGVTL